VGEGEADELSSLSDGAGPQSCSARDLFGSFKLQLGNANGPSLCVRVQAIRSLSPE
jgi:hypothetical protein